MDNQKGDKECENKDKCLAEKNDNYETMTLLRYKQLTEQSSERNEQLKMVIQDMENEIKKIKEKIINS
jgi:hypothetical protein